VAPVVGRLQPEVHHARDGELSAVSADSIHVHARKLPCLHGLAARRVEHNAAPITDFVLESDAAPAALDRAMGVAVARGGGGGSAQTDRQDHTDQDGWVTSGDLTILLGNWG